MLTRSRLSALSKYMRAPQFPEDNPKSIRARILNFSLWFIIAAIVINAFIATQWTDTYSYWQDIVLLILLSGVVIVLRRGYIQYAAWLTVTLTWLFIAVGFSEYSGILDPYYHSYLVLILIAGMVLPPYSIPLFTLLSLFMGALSYMDDPTSVARSTLVGVSIVYSCVAIVLYLAVRSTLNAFDDVKTHQTALERSNVQLQAEIQERKQVESALRESESRYRHLLEVSPVAILVSDAADRRILYTNPACLRLLHESTFEGIFGKTLDVLIQPGYLGQLEKRIQQIGTQKSLAPVEYALMLRDGTEISVEAGSEAITYEGKSAVLSVLSDITERKLAQAEQVRAEGLRIELEKQRQYVELRNSFIGMISHEFRNPLSVVQTSKDMLLRYITRMDDDQRTRHLSKIGVEVDRMASMLEDILVLSKANAEGMPFNPSLQSLETVCRELVTEFQDLPNIQHTVTVTLSVDADWQPSAVDESLIRTIMFNLLGNAVKYSPDAAQVDVSLKRDQSDAVLQVHDRGIGVSGADAARLFETFYRGSNTGKISGTGLGLAITYHCVIAHGGSIRYIPREGGGSIFEMRLPL